MRAACPGENQNNHPSMLSGQHAADKEVEMDYHIPYSETIVGCSGYTGLNLQQINLRTRQSAQRSIVATKGYCKAGLTH